MLLANRIQLTNVWATRWRPKIGCADRAHLAAAIAVQADVVGQQGLEPGEIARLGGRHEPAGELVLVVARRLEPRPFLLDVVTGAHRELPARGLALADDLGDVVVAVVEHLAQQEHGPLLG